MVAVILTNSILSAPIIGHALPVRVRNFKMARSTGPILAVGAITIANRSLLAEKQQDIDFKVIVGTAIAAGGLALLEKVSEELAVGLAWVALVAVLFTDLDKVAGAPAENLLRILGFQQGKGKRKP
jgi:hypothetical protein